MYHKLHHKNINQATYFLFNFTAYTIYCLQKLTENYKSYGQAPN